MRKTIDIMIDYIDIPKKRDRAADKAKLPDLMESIEANGLINAIAVTKQENGRYSLVAGLNRITACRELGQATIRSTVIEGDEDALRLVEIDENLIRNELGAALMSKLIAERSKLLVKRSKVIGSKLDLISPKRKGKGSATKVTTGTAEVAKLAGISKTEAKRAQKRGEALGDEVLDAVAGSSVDKGVNLDALMGATATEKAEVIALVKKEKAQKKTAPSMGGPRGVGTGMKAAEALALPVKPHSDVQKRIIKVEEATGNREAAVALKKIRDRQKAEAEAAKAPKQVDRMKTVANLMDHINASVLHQLEASKPEELDAVREIMFEKLTFVLGRIWPQVCQPSTKKTQKKVAAVRKSRTLESV